MHLSVLARWPTFAVLLCCAPPMVRSQAVATPTGAEAVFVRLDHPERQAAEVLRLFQGSPAPHPAAALAAWKRASHEPDRLGKRLEAVISFFNPQMVGEWSTFHDTRLELGIDPKSGAPRWAVLVPGDDGSLAAMITSLRLSAGAEEAPLDGGKTKVQRLGGPGKAVAASGSRGVVVASSRAELERSWKSITRTVNADPAKDKESSGLVFRIEPERITEPPNESLLARRAVELARGLGCRSIEGNLGLHDGRLVLEVKTLIKAAHPPGAAAARMPRIDPEWLSWVPARGAAALVCVATGAGAGYWDAVFSVADRVDRADPRRANLAPLRARLNLLATAAGARLEADLWPHLRGLTLGVVADSSGEFRGAVLALHLDGAASARSLLEQTLPRLAALRGGLKGVESVKDPRSLGKLNGRPLAATARGRTVLIAWGEGMLATALAAVEHPEMSVKAILGAVLDKNPDRLGVFWPGRMRLPIAGLDGPTPLARSLAEGAPFVWTGWHEGDLARDRVSWPELRPLVHRFLGRIPLAQGHLSGLMSEDDFNHGTH